MNHPVVQQYWRWCQNSISASCGYELLIISNEILHIPITLWGSSSFDNKETRTFLASIFFFVYKILLSCPYPGPVWCGESKQSAARNYLVITKAPMHIQKFGGQTKQLPSASELLPLLLSCQISIGSKFCINDDDDWEILIYQTCPPRQQIIFKAAQEHNNGFKLCFLLI